MAKKGNRKRNATPLLKDSTKTSERPERVQSSDDEEIEEVRRRILTVFSLADSIVGFF